MVKKIENLKNLYWLRKQNTIKNIKNKSANFLLLFMR